MACERYREALADMAAGVPAPAGLEAHLGSCEACREELHALRQALAVADAEMAGLLAAEPTAGLAVRIRQAVSEAREPSPHAPASLRQVAAESDLPAAWRFGWLWPATAAAATLLVALAVMLGRGTPPAPEPQVVVDAHRPQPAGNAGGAESSGAVVTPSADLPVPVSDGNDPVAPRTSGQAVRRGVRSPGGSLGTRQAGVPRDDRAPEPEVLVPPGEAEALLRLVALVHRDRIAPAVFGAAGQPSVELAELAAIDIKPLEIVPLDPAETSGT